MLSFFWIFVLAAHYTGLEPIEAPSAVVFVYLFFDVLFGVFGYEYFFCLSTVYLGPVTANVSTAAIIPFSMLLDAFWKHTKFSAFYFVATAGIFQSVITQNIIENIEQKEKEDKEAKHKGETVEIL